MMKTLTILVLFCLGLCGCGIVAAPCRVGSSGLKAVPLVGDVAAVPTDTCADVIDPDPLSRS
jgi:hypothetical protein